MTPFTEVQDGLVITCEKGVFKQVPLYRREQNLYAKHGNGFIRLYKRQATSKPNIRWIEYDSGDLKISDAESGEFYLTIIEPKSHKRIAKAA